MDIIFCGNPGVGKSTLLSSISNLRFESGISWGEGLTTELTYKSHPDLPIRFADTPGLADLENAETASVAITSALADGAETGKKSMIFFVVTMEAGRVRPNDLFTINQVMDSITLHDSSAKPGPNSYGVIINKCTFLEDDGFLKSGKQKFENIYGLQTETVPYPSTYLYFLPLVSQLVDQSNCSYLFEELVHWVYAFPGIKIGSVKKIDVSDIEVKLMKIKEMHNKEIKELEFKMSVENEKEMEEMKKRMEESRQDLRRNIHREEEERKNNRQFSESFPAFMKMLMSCMSPKPPEQ